VRGLDVCLGWNLRRHLGCYGRLVGAVEGLWLSVCSKSRINTQIGGGVGNRLAASMTGREAKLVRAAQRRLASSDKRSVVAAPGSLVRRLLKPSERGLMTRRACGGEQLRCIAATDMTLPAKPSPCARPRKEAPSGRYSALSIIHRPIQCITHPASSHLVAGACFEPLTIAIAPATLATNHEPFANTSSQLTLALHRAPQMI
jgi:hypothetical protein